MPWVALDPWEGLKVPWVALEVPMGGFMASMVAPISPFRTSTNGFNGGTVGDGNEGNGADDGMEGETQNDV